MSKKSALARKRAEQEAKQRRKARLKTAVIGAAVLIILAAVVGTVLYFTVFRESPPVAENGDELSVYYTLWLEDGTQVESNVGGDPIKFTLGTGDVIKGWDQDLVGMKKGETKTLTVPPELAYGAEGRPPKIPPNATLTFEVKLVAVNKASK